MNPITYALLLVLAYFFYEGGVPFLALLTVIVIVLMLVSSAATSSPASKSASAGGASPVVVQGPSVSIPNEIQFNPAWDGPTSGHEGIGKRFGEFGGFFVKLFRKLFD